MAIDLSNISVDKAVTTVAFGGQTAKITYRPTVITQETLDNLDSEDDGTIKFILACITDWDIKRGSKKVPLNVKELKTLPLPLLRGVALAILRDRGDGVGESETA
jgi:hypothetical protein